MQKTTIVLTVSIEDDPKSEHRRIVHLAAKEPAELLTAIHEKGCPSAEAHDFVGFPIEICVHDGDTLTLVARNDMCVIGCGFFEVRFDLLPHGVILETHVANNITIEQQRQATELVEAVQG